METIDLAIILLVLWSVYHGWKQGLCKELTSMVGFFVGLFVAYRLYDAFGNWLAPRIVTSAVVSDYLIKALAFVILWIVVPILLGVAANVLTRSFKGLHLGKLNSMAGAVVSLAKYIILISFVFGAMDYVGLMDNQKKKDSVFYSSLAAVAQGFFEGKEPLQAQPEETTNGDDLEEEETDTIWIDIDHSKKS